MPLPRMSMEMSPALPRTGRPIGFQVVPPSTLQENWMSASGTVSEPGDGGEVEPAEIGAERRVAARGVAFAADGLLAQGGIGAPLPAVGVEDVLGEPGQAAHRGAAGGGEADAGVGQVRRVEGDGEE